jgi:hypothetical protein
LTTTLVVSAGFVSHQASSSSVQDDRSPGIAGRQLLGRLG